MVTPAETKRLDGLLDRNDKMIADKKHNPITVFYKKKIKLSEFILDRIKTQRERIDRGVRSHELTGAEPAVLRDNLDRIRDEFQRFRNDGKLTWRESDRLNRMLDRNSEMIFAKKNNTNVRIERIDFKLFIDIN
jgi:hypothetical protein